MKKLTKTIFAIIITLVPGAQAWAGELMSLSDLQAAPDMVFSGRVTAGSLVMMHVESTLHDFDLRGTGIAGVVSGNPRRPTETISSVVTLKALSLDSNLGMRDSIMRKDVLEVDSYPEITFTLRGISNLEQHASKKSVTFTATGNLRLHGINKNIDARVEATLLNEKEVLAEGEFDINMTNWQIKPPTLLFQKVSPRLKIKFIIHIERVNR